MLNARRSHHPSIKDGERVNDHDAIDAITAALEDWFSGREADSLPTLNRIAEIIGANKTEHEESK
jgi:hypothetical protein